MVRRVIVTGRSWEDLWVLLGSLLLILLMVLPWWIDPAPTHSPPPLTAHQSWAADALNTKEISLYQEIWTAAQFIQMLYQPDIKRWPTLEEMRAKQLFPLYSNTSPSHRWDLLAVLGSKIHTAMLFGATLHPDSTGSFLVLMHYDLIGVQQPGHRPFVIWYKKGDAPKSPIPMTQMLVMDGWQELMPWTGAMERQFSGNLGG